MEKNDYDYYAKKRKIKLGKMPKMKTKAALKKDLKLLALENKRKHAFKSHILTKKKLNKKEI